MISPHMGEILNAGLGRTGRTPRNSEKEKDPSTSTSSSSTMYPPPNHALSSNPLHAINSADNTISSTSIILGSEDDGNHSVLHTHTNKNNTNTFNGTIESPVGKPVGTDIPPRDVLPWEGLDLLSGFDLAEELRFRMKHASSGEHVCSGDDFDEIIKSQFDDEDFERTDNKEMDMRRVREVSKIMAKIRKTSTDVEISGACEKLMDTISMWPEVTDHFIKHFGVTPIFDIFDACIGSSSHLASSTTSASSASVGTHSVNTPYPLIHPPIFSPYQSILLIHPINLTFGQH